MPIAVDFVLPHRPDWVGINDSPHVLDGDDDSRPCDYNWVGLPRELVLAYPLPVRTAIMAYRRLKKVARLLFCRCMWFPLYYYIWWPIYTSTLGACLGCSFGRRNKCVRYVNRRFLCGATGYDHMFDAGISGMYLRSLFPG